MDQQERRVHPRYQSPGLVAIVRRPEDVMDCYFEVANVSLHGVALVISEPKAEHLSLREDSVFDIEVYAPARVVRCRGVVVRVTQVDGETVRCLGVRLYSFPTGQEELWATLVQEQKKRNLE